MACKSFGDTTLELPHPLAYHVGGSVLSACDVSPPNGIRWNLPCRTTPATVALLRDTGITAAGDCQECRPNSFLGTRDVESFQNPVAMTTKSVWITDPSIHRTLPPLTAVPSFVTLVKHQVWVFELARGEGLRFASHDGGT